MSDAGIPLDTLLGWLDHDPDRFERHITDFPEDADRLDLATALPLLGERLRSALIVPDGVAEQVRRMVQGDPAKRDAGAVLFDLLGTTLRTASLLWQDEELS